MGEFIYEKLCLTLCFIDCLLLLIASITKVYVLLTTALNDTQPLVWVMLTISPTSPRDVGQDMFISCTSSNSSLSVLMLTLYGVGVLVPSKWESDIAFELLKEQNNIKASPKTAVGFDRENNFFIIDFFGEWCKNVWYVFYSLVSKLSAVSSLYVETSMRVTHAATPIFCWNGDGMSHVGKCMQNICILILLW